MPAVETPAAPPAKPPPRRITDPPRGNQLGVSLYERVASTIVSLLFLVGFVVLVLFIIVVTRRLMSVRQTVPVEYIEAAEGRGDHALGFARDPEPPGAEELEQLEEPQLEQSLEAVTDAVSSVAASVEAVEGAAVPTTAGTGQGDSRKAGPLGEGDDIIPRGERWQIQYPASNLKTYARILDHFGVELGVVGGGRSDVEYARNLASSSPTKYTGPPDEEERLYMTWRTGEMKQADQELLSDAGIDAGSGIQMQFIPPDTENLLAAAEQQAMGDRPLKEVQKTVFGVRPQGSGFEFYVIEQRYRRVN